MNVNDVMRNLESGDDGICVFCGIGIEDKEARAAGPTTDYGWCCQSCFERHVGDHRHPKFDIFKESNSIIDGKHERTANNS